MTDAIRKAFDHFDKDHSGTISTSELKNVMVALGENPTAAQIDAIVKEADKNASGTIEFGEFLKALESRSKTARMKLSDKQMLEVFKLFDGDKDGQITQLELRSAVKQLGLTADFPDVLVDRMFTDTDINHDGKISMDEYLSAMKK